jgi:protein ImuB
VVEASTLWSAGMHWIALQPALDPPCTELTDPVTALGWWALRYTPKVARQGQVLLLEVSASARLWGGLPALLQAILIENKPVALAAYAQAATSLIALAQLAVAPDSSVKPRPGLAVDDLPLHTLAAASPWLGTLARLGVSTWGQLRELPRGGLVRRFGAPLVDALDQAYGTRPDIYPWLELPAVFEASLELTSQVESAPALLFAARRLLAQMRVWLQLRHRGVLALELSWQMDERRHTATQGALLLRTAQPTQDSTHLQRLLGEHLAHERLPAPAHTLRLRTVETATLANASASLLPDTLSMGDNLAQMVERLSARLGHDKVLQLQPRQDHRPEHMQTWLEAATQSIASHACPDCARGLKRLNFKKPPAEDPQAPWAQALYPTWLLQEPRQLTVCHQRPHYQGPLTLLAGPQRLESGWWGGGDLALRDYFVARSVQAGLLWIYRERLRGSGTQADVVPAWYLHGIFA